MASSNGTEPVRGDREQGLAERVSAETRRGCGGQGTGCSDMDRDSSGHKACGRRGCWGRGCDQQYVTYVIFVCFAIYYIPWSLVNSSQVP
jgi:hypothetical protein